MSWLDTILGRAVKAAAPRLDDKIDIAAVAIVDLGEDVAVVFSPDGDFGVRFETSCESLITLWCFDESGARVLAALIRSEMMSSDVDVQLDQVTA